MKFKKLEALGNDYIYLNNLNNNLTNFNMLAYKLCKYKTGIGANGIIVLEKSDIADFKMRIFNSDGSEANYCGNGIRGLAKYVYEEGIIKKDLISFETKVGIKNVKLIISFGKVSGAILDAGIIINNDIKEDKIIIDDYVYHYNFIDVGVPHTIILTNNIADINIEKIGPKIENHPTFKDKTNVEFVKLINNDSFTMKIWERGTTNTLSCGSGALAAHSVLKLKKMINNRANIYLKNGILKVFYNPCNMHSYLSGPINNVFEGEIKKKI